MDDSYEYDTICTITIQTKGEDREDVLEMRRDLALFLFSVGARVLQGPLNKNKDPDLITTTFELVSEMKKAVEDFFYLSRNYPEDFPASLTFDEIEPLKEPAKGIYIV